MSDFVFRALGVVVNTAARAANCALEVMYPREDPGHIWDEGFVSSVAGVAGSSGTAANPPAADPGGVTTTPTSTPPGSLTWEGWAVPAILDVLAEHRFCVEDGATPHSYRYYCINTFEVQERHHTFDSAGYPGALDEWAEHVAPIIAARIGCDPTRAVLALTSLQTQ